MFLVDELFSILPFGREVLEAITALLAVAVLFYVSFWLIARLEQQRWLEFLRARIWTAVSVGLGDLARADRVHGGLPRGLRDLLFYQALISFGTGLGAWIVDRRCGRRRRAGRDRVR